MERGWTNDDLNYHIIGLFLCEHVRRNNGSSRSLDNVYSNIKVYLLHKGHGELSNMESAQLRLLIKQLKYEDLSAGNRKWPLTRKHLDFIASSMDLGDKYQLQTITMFAVAHDGLLRAGELLSERKCQHVLWHSDDEGFDLLLDRTKTNLSGPSIMVSFRDYSGEFTAVKLLRKWFELCLLWNKSSTVLFPSRQFNGDFNWSKTMSYGSLLSRVKHQCHRVGLDAKYYGCHSFRAGGATDLFVARVPYHIIKRMGRWKSDAAMIYYRDEEDVIEGVRRGFEEVAEWGFNGHQAHRSYTRQTTLTPNIKYDR